MDDFLKKTDLIASIFASPTQEVVKSGDNTPLQDGNYYGGIYNGRKYLYSEIMIKTLSLEKLESFIKKQINHDSL